MDRMEQPKIKGYRHLTDDEAKLMNEIKDMAEAVGALVFKLRTTDDLDQRWISIGATDLQLGFIDLR